MRCTNSLSILRTQGAGEAEEGSEFQGKWEKPLLEAWRSHVWGARQPECRR